MPKKHELKILFAVEGTKEGEKQVSSLKSAAEKLGVSVDKVTTTQVEGQSAVRKEIKLTADAYNLLTQALKNSDVSPRKKTSTDNSEKVNAKLEAEKQKEALALKLAKAKSFAKQEEALFAKTEAAKLAIITKGKNSAQAIEAGFQSKRLKIVQKANQNIAKAQESFLEGKINLTQFKASYKEAKRSAISDIEEIAKVARKRTPLTSSNADFSKRQASLKAHNKRVKASHKAREVEVLAIVDKGASSREALIARFQRSRIDLTNKTNTKIAQIEKSFLQGGFNFNTLNRKLAATRKGAIAELEKLRVEFKKALPPLKQAVSFDQASATRALSRVRKFAAIERDIRKAGGNQRLIDNLNLNKQRLEAEIQVQDRIAKIKSKANSGRLNAAQTQTAVTAASKKYEQSLRRINKLQQESVRSKRVEVDLNGLLVKRILSVAIGYRAVNAVLHSIGTAIRNIPKLGLEQQAIQASLEGVFGTKALDDINNFVSGVADRTGQAINLLEKQYSKFGASAKLAGATQAEVNQIFEDFTVVGTVLHKTQDQLDSVFIALDQIFGKGVANSEEVKRQLGNQLPAVIEIAAKAMEKTPAQFFKAMKANEVIAKEFVPKFAALYRKIFSGENDEVLLTLQDKLFVNYTRLLNEYTEATRKTFAETEKAMVSLTKTAKQALLVINENFRLIVDAAKLFFTLLATRGVTALSAVILKNVQLTASNIALKASYVNLGKASRAASAANAASGASGVLLANLKKVRLMLAAIAAGGLTLASTLTGLSSPVVAVAAGLAATLAISAKLVGLDIKRGQLLTENKEKILSIRRELAQALEEGSKASPEKIAQLREELKLLEQGQELTKQLIVTFEGYEVSVGSFFKAMGDNIKRSLTAVKDSIKALFTDMTKGFTSLSSDIADKIKGAVLSAISNILILQRVGKEAITGQITSVNKLKEALAKAREELSPDKVQEVLSNTANIIADNVAESTSGLREGIKDIANSASEGVTAVTSAVKGSVESVVIAAAAIDKAATDAAKAQLNAKPLIDPAEFFFKQEEYQKTLKQATSLSKVLVREQEANNKALKTRFDQGLLTFKEFYNGQLAIINKISELRKQPIREAISKKEKSLKKLPPKLQDTSVRDKIKEELSTLREELGSLEAARSSKVAQLDGQAAEQAEKYASSLFNVKVALLEQKGLLIEAERLRQAASTEEERRLEIEANGGDTRAQLALDRINYLNKIRLAEAGIAEFEDQRALLEEQYANKRTAIELQHTTILGLSATGVQELTTATEEYIKQINNLSTTSDIVVEAAATGNQKVIAAAATAKVKAQNDIADLIEEGQAQEIQIVQGLRGSLENALTGIISQTKTAKQAFADLASSIIQQLAKIAAQKLIFSLLNLVPGVGSALSLTGSVTSIANSAGGVSNSGGFLGGNFSGAASSSITPSFQSSGVSGVNSLTNAVPISAPVNNPIPVEVSTPSFSRPYGVNKKGEALPAGGGVTITQQITFQTSQNESEDNQKELADLMKATIDQRVTGILEKNSRPGNAGNRTPLKAF